MRSLFLTFLIFTAFLVILSCTSVDSVAEGVASAQKGRITLSEADRSAIGRKIWQNECAGTVSGLTSWNKGEDFPSLGIGHFIWYVPGRPGPFDESFPPMIQFLRKSGVAVPRWVAEAPGSLWSSRDQFLAAQESPQMQELRNFLAATVPHQTAFIVDRLERSLPKMKAATSSASDRQRLERNFYAVASSRAGVYALIDYVNFKGEGIKSTEKYKGKGWGLRDVLLLMNSGHRGPANYEFSEAAKRALSRRVQNSPPARNENRWLNGWKVRCDGYKKGI